MRKYTVKQKSVLLAASFLMVAFALAHTSVGYFVAPVTESLGIQRSAFTFYYTVLQLVSIGAIPLFGQLLTHVSIRKILICSSIWGAACFLGFAVSQNIWMLYFFGALFGVVVSGCTSLTVAVIINSYFGEQSGTPMGISMAGTGICGILQGFLLPSLLANMGWRVAYVALGVCWGATLLGAAFLIGKQQASTVRTASKREKDIDTHGSPVKWTAGLVLFMACIVVFSVHGSFLHHMQAHFTEQGISTSITGVFMSFFNVFVIIFKISQGYLFDRLGAIKTTAAAFAVFAAGLLLATTHEPVLLFISMIFLAFGMSAETVLTPLMTREIFGIANYTIVYARVSMAYSCGTAFGSPLWGAIYDLTKSYMVGLLSTPWILMADLLLITSMIRKRRNMYDTTL